ncbi:tetratricopeptide repeat protein [Desulfonatronospira sp. MSAO_Bac3]|uniref:tetratricopeptide repeat protein n=1 Tax=Desulfonatronospira sp. MSAO_Bac3 TaxID=2293857 RepID=UPI000FF5DADB|nr:tetratricopeptide repeat protein [Desulfonatronospira sp. MSAO_Bac3]RQD78610.1 MAG: sel1 repeat family protein [Desulfonatronospira sp. MSAO_Bac3]
MKYARSSCMYSAVFFFLLLAWVPHAWCSDLEEAHEAYRSGNWHEAAELYRPLAEQGCDEAQNNLGELYSRGSGVKQDYDRAMELFYLAAEQGNAYAQTNLGLHYSQGLGVRQNFARAHKWFEKGARQDNFVAQNALGLFYLHGRNLEKDYVLAYKWFYLSAQKGFDQAQENKRWTASRLSQEDLDKARKLAREFEPGFESGDN